MQILRALHDRMLDVLMLSSAVEDSLARLRSSQASAMDSPGWRELMQTGLAAQQAELDLAHADCRVLQAQLCAAAPAGAGMYLPALPDMRRVRYFTGIIGLPCAARWARSSASC